MKEMKHYFLTKSDGKIIFPSTRITARSLKHIIQSLSSKNIMIFNTLE